jgi:hypothetical protein
MKFIDKDKESNLVDGIEYFAVGLVTDCHMVDGEPTPNGKDYVVEYIDPFGNFQIEYRSADEIEVSPIDDADFERLDWIYEKFRDARRIKGA